jgi:hypothetical protein
VIWHVHTCPLDLLGVSSDRVGVEHNNAPFLPFVLSSSNISRKRSSTTTFDWCFFGRRNRGSVLRRANRGSDMNGVENKTEKGSSGNGKGADAKTGHRPSLLRSTTMIILRPSRCAFIYSVALVSRSVSLLLYVSHSQFLFLKTYLPLLFSFLFVR